MKKLLLFLSACALSLGASAITVQDLVGKPVLQLFWGNAYQGYGPTLSPQSGTFALEDGQLYILGFRGRFKLPVTFDQANQTLIFPLQENFSGYNQPAGNTFQSGIMAAVQGKNYSVGRAFVVDASGTIHNTLVGSTYNGNPATCYMTMDQYGSIQTTAYSTRGYAGIDVPNFVIDKASIPASILMVNSANTAYLNRNDSNPMAIYSKMAFYVLNETNARATDSQGQDYKLNISLLGGTDNQLEFRNLFNAGVSYEYDDNLNYSTKWLTGSFDRENKTIKVNAGYSGGLIIPHFVAYGTRNSGTFPRAYHLPAGTYTYYYDDFTTGQAYSRRGYFDSSNPPLYKATEMIQWTGYWYHDGGGSSLGDQIVGSELSGDYILDIEGTFDVERVYHETPSHQWVHHCGGPLHTYEDWAIKLDDARYYNNALTGSFAEETFYDWTNIDLDKLDVTHNCTVENLQHGFGQAFEGDNSNYIYVSGNVKQLLNSHHVDADNYEYFMAPGKLGTPNTADFNHENGHVKGINVTDYISWFKPGQKSKAMAPNKDAQQYNEGLNFNLLVPESAFGDNVDPNGNYTLYVKANYKTAGLEPTFHAITPVLLEDSTTGVEDLLAQPEAEAAITVNGNEITIAGSNGNAIVTSTSGAVIYQGGDNAVTVTPGIYIVRANKTVKKVIVK